MAVSIPQRQKYVGLARNLPIRLTDFFRRYPPPLLSRTSAQEQSLADNDTNSPDQSTTPSDASLEGAQRYQRNPFQPYKHPVTGRWHGPLYSLKRQAELVKLARLHGVEELLPYTVKGTEERLRRKDEHGLRVKGTGVGQKVRGKAWERLLKGK